MPAVLPLNLAENGGTRAAINSHCFCVTVLEERLDILTTCHAVTFQFNVSQMTQPHFEPTGWDEFPFDLAMAAWQGPGANYIFPSYSQSLNPWQGFQAPNLAGLPLSYGQPQHSPQTDSLLTAGYPWAPADSQLQVPYPEAATSLPAPGTSRPRARNHSRSDNGGSRKQSRAKTALVNHKIPLHPQWSVVLSTDDPASQTAVSKGKLQKDTTQIMTTTRFEALFQKAKDEIEKSDRTGERVIPAPFPGATYLRGHPPPLVLYAVEDYKELLSLVRSVAKNPRYTFSVGKGSDRLQMKTMEDYVHVSQLLYCRGIQMSTWPTKEERVKPYLISGFPWNLGEEGLRDELQHRGYPVRSVYPRRNSEENGRGCLFIATIWMSGNWSERELLSITTIQNTKVHIKPYVFRQPRICSNCCRFGHTAYFCVAKQRCYKCAKNHDPGECLVGPESPERFCCNCGGNHYAIDHDCPTYKETMEKLESTGKIPSSSVLGDFVKESSIADGEKGWPVRCRSYREVLDQKDRQREGQLRSDAPSSTEGTVPPFTKANFPTLPQKGRALEEIKDEEAPPDDPMLMEGPESWDCYVEDPIWSMVSILDSLISSTSMYYARLVGLRALCLQASQFEYPPNERE